MGVISEEFVRIRADTSSFTPELQAALTAAVEGAERSVEDIDINAELAATTLGKLEAQTAAAVQGVESSIEDIDVGAGLAPSAPKALHAEASAAVQAVESLVEEIDVKAGLAPSALGELQATTAAAVQAVESSTETISVDAALDPDSIGVLKAQTAAAVQAVESTTETISVNVGVNPASLGVLKAETEAASLAATGSFGRITSAAGATGIAIATIAAVGVGSVKFFTDLTEKVRDFSAVTGASLEQSSRLVEVFGDLGFSADAAERAFFLLNKNIATGSANLEKFGVETVKANDGSTDYIETLLSIATAYQTAGTDAEKTGILFAAFGKSGASLAPILNQNATALRAMFDAVTADKIIDADDVARAQELRLAVDDLADGFEAVLLPLARGLAPILLDAAEALNGIIKLLGLFDLNVVEGAYASLQAQALEAGVAVEGLTQVVDGQVVALEAADTATASLVDGALRDLQGLAIASGTVIEGLTEKVDGQVVAVDANAVALAEMQAATLGLTGEVEELATAYDLQAEALSTVQKAMDESLGVVLSLRDANRDLREKTDAYTESLEENGRGADETKAKFDDLVESTLDQVAAHVTLTDATETDTQIRRLNVQALKALAEQHPENEKLIREYIKAIKDTPSEQVTTPKFPTAAAKAKIDELVGDIKAINRRVEARQLGADIVLGIAAGMTANEQFVVAAAEKAVSRAMAAARAAADAESPSKKMIALGEDIVAGLVVGIEKSSSRADSAFGKVVEGNINRLEGRLDKLKDRGSDLHVGAIRDQLDAFAAEGGKLKDVLDAAVEQVAERMGDLVNAVASGVGAGADIVGQFGNDETVTGASLIAGLQANLAESQSFATSLASLAAGGLNTATLTQLAAQGPSEASAALIAAIQEAGIANINALQGQINQVALNAAEAIGEIVLPRETVEAGVAEAESNFNAFLVTFNGFMERLEAKLDREAEQLTKQEKRDEARERARERADKKGLTGDARTTFIINEVASDPRATAAAVSARLGIEATR